MKLWRIEAYHDCVIERFPLRVAENRDVLTEALAKLERDGVPYRRIESITATPDRLGCELLSE